MRFDVFTLACAFAAPIMAAQVGFAQGQQGGLVEEWENPTTPIPNSTPTPTPTPTSTSAVGHAQGGGQLSSAGQTTSTSSTAGAVIPPVASKPTTTTSSKPNQGVGATPSTFQSSATPTPSPSTGGNTGGSTGGSTGSSTSGSVIGSGGSAPPGGQIVYIVNKYGATLNIATTKNSNNMPDPGNLPSSIAAGATATVSVPNTWGGRFALNPTSVPLGNEIGTKIEGSVSSGVGYWDISLVDGYTVPITCSCASQSNAQFIGCNIDLFKQGKPCQNPSGDSKDLCLNPGRNTNKVDPWFEVCEAASYTFPSDDAATRSCAGNAMTCCAGAACPPSVLQKTKRDLNPVAKRWAIPRSVFEME